MLLVPSLPCEVVSIVKLSLSLLQKLANPETTVSKLLFWTKFVPTGEGVGLTLGLGLAEGLTDGLGETEGLGLTEGEGLTDGTGLADGEALGETDGTA